jgi:hypothetical protein
VPDDAPEELDKVEVDKALDKLLERKTDEPMDITEELLDATGEYELEDPAEEVAVIVDERHEVELDATVDERLDEALVATPVETLEELRIVT